MRALVVLILFGALAAPAAAAPFRVKAKRPDVGWIDFVVAGTKGKQFTVTEAGEPVGTYTLKAERQRFRHVLPWRCDRLERVFEAVSADGETSIPARVRTRTCRHRLAMTITPAFPRSKRPVAVRVEDRWRTGDVRGSVCLTPRRGTERCRSLRIRPGKRFTTVKVKAAAPGVGAIEVRPGWGGALRRAVDLRRPGRKLQLLATGDSMIQVVDGFLKERLRSHGVSVASDARISTGVTKPFLLDWVSLARHQAVARHPDVTVVFLGANDGFPIGSAQCCGKAWIEGYAARVRRMMAAYSRGGASRVYWLTLPTPSKPAFARIFRSVNKALRIAARSLGDRGRLLDMGRVFTPGGRFVGSFRQADGVHLNVRGARIAARVIASALRRDGISS